MPRTSVRLISASDSGHRLEYNRLLIAELDSLGISLERNLSTAPSATFFAMLDDHSLRFVFSAAGSLLTDRRTVGLYFNPLCFRRSKLTRLIKRALFRVLSRLPRTTVLTILPFSIDQRFSLVATDWIYDPQLWDLQFFGMPPENAFLGLDNKISEAAKGRSIVLALGKQDRIKGFKFFCHLWCDAPDIRARHLFIAAGAVEKDLRSVASRFVAAGGLLIDRRMEDAEMLHLYRRAASIWSCYAPDYDQASGIFGRAVQLGVPVIVRAGSYLETVAADLDHPALALPYGRADTAAAAILNWQPNVVEPPVAEARSQMMRARSLNVLVHQLTNEPAGKTSISRRESDRAMGNRQTRVTLQQCAKCDTQRQES